MKTSDFKKTLAVIEKLTPRQRERLQEELNHAWACDTSSEKPVNRRSKRSFEYREFLRILTEESEYIRKIIDLSSDMVVSVDDDRGIHIFNVAAQRVYGYALHEVRGKPVDMLYASVEESRRVAEGMRRHGAFTGEISSRRKNGDIFPLRIIASTLHDAYGTVVGSVGYSRDLTAEHKAAEVARQYTALIELEKLKQDVDRMTRHDLKSPLNAVIGFTDLLLSDDTIGVEQKEQLGYIFQSSQKLLRLINLGVDIFKMEQGTFQLAPKEIDLVAVLQGIHNDYKHLIRSKKLTLNLRVNGHPAEENMHCMALGEASLCYNLFANLIKNAVEASSEKQSVTTSLENRPETILIKTHNVGVVPEEIRETFFQKYTTMGKKNGLGLGTYSAYLMTIAQGGTIQMETSQSEGTTIIVELPRPSPS